MLSDMNSIMSHQLLKVGALNTDHCRCFDFAHIYLTGLTFVSFILFLANKYQTVLVELCLMRNCYIEYS